MKEDEILDNGLSVDTSFHKFLQVAKLWGHNIVNLFFVIMIAINYYTSKDTTVLLIMVAIYFLNSLNLYLTYLRWKKWTIKKERDEFFK